MDKLTRAHVVETDGNGKTDGSGLDTDEMTMEPSAQPTGGALEIIPRPRPRPRPSSSSSSTTTTTTNITTTTTTTLS